VIWPAFREEQILSILSFFYCPEHYRLEAFSDDIIHGVSLKKDLDYA
jgi:hypothetical protein